MRPFAYVRPTSLASVFDTLRAHGAGARLLAGGTDVVARMRTGHLHPEILVDVKGVAELRGDIVEHDGNLRIGARAVMTEVLEDARVRRQFPALADSARVVGSIQIRNRATVAGNLCNASPAADTAPALLVYDAVVNAVSAAGSRRIPLSAFFAGPGKTALEPGEVVESIDLPLPASHRAAVFGRITRRRGVDLATVNLCCLVNSSGLVRFAYGAVGPRPFLVQDDSGVLAGRSGSRASREALIEQFVAEASPISDVRGSRDYRLAMLQVMSRRTLAAAYERLQHVPGRG